MAAPAVVGAAVAPVRLAPVPGTTLANHPVARMLTSSPKLWDLPRDSPVLKSLKFLTRVVHAAPALVEVESAELGSIILAALSFDSLTAADTAALARANLIEHEFSMAEANLILSELYQARVFAVSYDDLDAFLRAVEASTLLNKGAMTFRAAMVAQCDPFDALGRPGHPGRAGRRGAAAVPAVPAVPGVPGPPELRFLQKCKWGSLIGKGRLVVPSHPGYLLSMVIAILSNCDLDATRRDDGSRCRLVASLLESHIREAMKLGATSGDAALAADLPAYFERIYGVLPSNVRGSGRACASVNADMRDSHVLLVGKEAEVDYVHWSRVHDHLYAFDGVSDFYGKTTSVSDTRQVFETLSTKYISTAVKLTPLVRVERIGAALRDAKKGETIGDLFAGGATATEVADELVGGRESLNATDAISGGGSGAPDGSGTGAVAVGSAGGPLTMASLERAFDKDFHDTVKEAEGLQGVALLEVVACSSSVILLRFFYMAPAFLVTKHEIFGRLSKALVDRREYLSQCVVLDPNEGDDGAVPDKFCTYKISEALCADFLAFRWGELDLVNQDTIDRSVGGFLAVRHLETACTYSAVVAGDFYTVESCLLGMRDLFNRMLLGAGFSATPDEGFTWLQVVEEQVLLLRYISGLPASERSDWLTWAGRNFVENALGRAASLAATILRSSEPHSEIFGAFLPPGAFFFNNIMQRMRKAEPVAQVRLAFPHLMPAEPISLPGTSSSPVGGGAQTDGAKTKAQRKKEQEEKKRKEATKSGGGLSTMLNSGNMFLAGYTYDVVGVASKCQLDVHDKCWPVLFTTKSGQDKLQVCLDPKNHGGLGAPEHKAPPGFDRTKLATEFSKPATADERKEAGWASSSGKKKKN